jgi:hypothetical protein
MIALGVAVAVALVAFGLVAYAIHAIDARLSVLEDMSDEPRGCIHPEVENVGTFGAPEYVCAVCHARVG